GAGPAIAATEALERRTGLRWQQRLGLRVLAESVIPLEGGKSAVLRVHVLAGCNVLRGEADDLRELQHRLALGDLCDRHLMAAREADACGDAPRHRAQCKPVHGNDDTVPIIETKYARCGRGGRYVVPHWRCPPVILGLQVGTDTHMTM